jgi:hypothetical protein
MLFRFFAAAALCALFTGCATQPSQPFNVPSQPFAPILKPNTPTKPDANADWQNLGVSPNGNILNELDKLSVKRNGDQVTFRDKKTIFNPKKENFLSTPPHKYSINTWQIDCGTQTFRLLNMSLFDENGRQVASYTYNDKQIKAMPIVKNSASFQQMKFVCSNPAI